MNEDAEELPGVSFVKCSGDFRFLGVDDEPMVTIKPDGRVIIHQTPCHHPMIEAAKMFWGIVSDVGKALHAEIGSLEEHVAELETTVKLYMEADAKREKEDAEHKRYWEEIVKKEIAEISSSAIERLRTKSRRVK